MTRSNVSNPAQRIELTERQEAVVRLIAKGLTNAEIADRLGLTLDGVKWHVREILGRLGAESREEAVELWREQRSSARRARHWAGALGSSLALRWTGGAVLAGGACMAGVALAIGAFSAAEPPADEPLLVAAATPTPTPPPDLATKQGLTLNVTSVRADDTQTQVEIKLEGDPELGRIFNLQSKYGPGPNVERVRIVDDAGATYNVGPVESNGDSRRRLLHFGPVSPNTRWLDLVIPVVSFVAPEDEPAAGEPPPTASTSVEGPWRVRIHEIPRTDVARHALNLQPLPLGPGTAVPFEAIHTAEGTLLGIRFEALDRSGHDGFVPFPVLTSPNGERVPMRNSGSPRNDAEVVYMSYERTHGDVTLTVRPHIILGLPGNVCATPDNEHCVPAEEVERKRPEAEAQRAALEALFASQAEPT